MTLVTLVSHRGSPGTTSLALALAAAWPAPFANQKILVEADPVGGVLSLRLGIPEDPGLVSLAAATRHGLQRDELWEHAQALPGGLAVVPGPSSVAVASQLLATCAANLAGWLAARPDLLVVADAGRLSPSSVALPFVQAADLVVVVAAPIAEQLHGAAQQLSILTSDTPVGWCLVGDGQYDVASVEDAFSIPVIGMVPVDRRGADQLFGKSPGKKLERTPLVRGATSMAHHLAPWLEQRAEAGGLETNGASTS